LGLRVGAFGSILGSAGVGGSTGAGVERIRSAKSAGSARRATPAERPLGDVGEWTLESETAAEPGRSNGSNKAASRRGKAATQDRILQAAMSLFMRRGYARTSVTQIASKAGVSRAAVFWHFSDKDTLFRAAAKQFVVPFREGLSRHMRHLEPRKRIVELITYYEKFVEQNRPNIVAFVNWVLESPEQSEPMRDELLGLHEAFRSEVETALTEILADADRASEYADGLISLMDGNLMLGIFGAGAAARARQRSGLRAVADLILSCGDPEKPN
jgi:AcrR family transcriptional regulator